MDRVARVVVVWKMNIVTLYKCDTEINRSIKAVPSFNLW